MPASAPQLALKKTTAEQVMARLSGKVAIVTGAAMGIGRACVDEAEA